jgi:hypothetical protein
MPMPTPIDREKLLSLGYLSRGRTRDRVKEGRRTDGVRMKATTDELGNTVTEHNVPGDRVDVHIKAPHLRIKAGTTTEEVR